MNMLLTSRLPRHLKTFKGALIAFNATALLVIFGVTELTAPVANAAPQPVNNALEVCIRYAQAEDGYNFSDRFNSCASVLNIQQHQSFEF